MYEMNFQWSCNASGCAHSVAGWAEQGRWEGYQACRRRRPAADTDEVLPLLGRLLVLVVVLVPDEEVAAQEARGLPWTVV